MLLRQLQRPLARSVAPAIWPRIISPPAFAGRLLLHGSSGDSNHDDNPPRDSDDNQTTQREDGPQQQPKSSTTEAEKPKLYDELFPEAKKNDGRPPPLDDTQHSRWASQMLDEPPPVLDVPEGLDVDDGPSDPSVPRPTSMLVLSATSKNLVESDFLRLGVKGRHVEGWVSGILKVIQARDPDTLEPLDFYYILFNSGASAAAYSLEVVRLWKLNKQDNALKTRTGGRLARVTRTTSNGGGTDENDGDEDLAHAMRSFTLAPPVQRHYVEQESYPSTALERRLRMQGAAPGGRSWAEALAAHVRMQLQLLPEAEPNPQPEQPQPQPQPGQQQNPSPSSSSSSSSSSPIPPPSPAVTSEQKLSLVLLTIDGSSGGGDGRATPDALRRAIQDDGAERNLAWRVVGLAENDDAGGDGKNRNKGIIPLGLGKSSTKQADRLAVAAAAAERKARREKWRNQELEQLQQWEDEEFGDEDGEGEVGSNIESNSSGADDDATNAEEASSSNNDGSGGAETSTSSSSSSPSSSSPSPSDRRGKERKKTKESAGDKRQQNRLYTRFLIAFADEAEARRFVRCWHRRELMLPTLQRLQQVQRKPQWSLGEPRVVNASVLW